MLFGHFQYGAQYIWISPHFNLLFQLRITITDRFYTPMCFLRQQCVVLPSEWNVLLMDRKLIVQINPERDNNMWSCTQVCLPSSTIDLEEVATWYYTDGQKKLHTFCFRFSRSIWNGFYPNLACWVHGHSRISVPNSSHFDLTSVWNNILTSFCNVYTSHSYLDILKNIFFAELLTACRADVKNTLV